eukprot:1207385-Amphidinium_carterae.1
MVDGQTAVVFALRSQACQLRHQPEQAAVLWVESRLGDPQATSAVSPKSERPGLGRLILFPMQVGAGVSNRND